MDFYLFLVNRYDGKGPIRLGHIRVSKIIRVFIFVSYTYLYMGKKKLLKKLKSKSKWKKIYFYPSVNGSFNEDGDWKQQRLNNNRDYECVRVKPNKHIYTTINEWKSKRINPKKKVDIEELNNGVVPKKTLIEIGKGWDKRKIDISQYILKE